MPKIKWRRPFWIAVPKGERSTIEMPLGGIWPSTKGIIPVSEREINDKKNSFKLVNADLLIAIDDDNVKNLAAELKRTKLNPNQLYVIPHWEIPEAYPWPGEYIESFLNRAVETNSTRTFCWLLAHGANPRSTNYLGKSVLEQVFEKSEISNLEKAQMGYRLIDAGLNTRDLLTCKRRIFLKKRKSDLYTFAMIYEYAVDKKIKSAEKITDQSHFLRIEDNQKERI